MGSASLNGSTATIGNGVADPGRYGDDYRPHPSLFPDARPNLLEFLRGLIGSRFKEVAVALYPSASVEQACTTLSRNLAGRDRRKIGVHELDAILDVLGQDAEEAWWRVALTRRGWKPPERQPDPVRVQAELAEVRRGLTQATSALKQLAMAVEHIEGGIK